MSARLLWLPDALKDAGLKVTVTAGWETRGSAAMNARGLVLHHTAGPQGRSAPSLRVVVTGRPDLPGPLCHVLVGRDLTCHIIASGRAHHAGAGGWRGLSGNASVIGVECENDGVREPWSAGMVDAMTRISAACASTAGFSSEMVCGHKEWAPRRKIDPHAISMTDIRRRVAALLASPLRSAKEFDDMAPHVEQIRTAYKRVRGNDYDPATRDNGGWTHWMRALGDAPDRAAAKAIVQQAELLLYIESTKR